MFGNGYYVCRNKQKCDGVSIPRRGKPGKLDAFRLAGLHPYIGGETTLGEGQMEQGWARRPFNLYPLHYITEVSDRIRIRDQLG